MADDPVTSSDEAELLLRIAVDRDEEALRLFLALHQAKVYGWLVRRHGQGIADEAFYRAAWNLWRWADRYDSSKGDAGPWFLRIAQKAALSVIRGEARHAHAPLQDEVTFDPAECSPEEDEEYAATQAEKAQQRARRDKDLHAIVNKLPRLQREVTIADLADSTGTAPAEQLVVMLDTSKSAVYAARSKARKTTREEMSRLGYYRPSDGERSHAQ